MSHPQDHTAALLPCPFCGGTPEFERIGTARQSCIVTCTNCGTRHESSDEGSECGASWNNRLPAASDAGAVPDDTYRMAQDDRATFPAWTVRKLWELKEHYRLLAAPSDAAAPVEAGTARFDMVAHLARQREWSERTFGPGARAKGVVDHIRKELCEIEADPGDLKEWVDVVILALDGAWRSSATPTQIVDAIVAKQTKNEGRQWPDWRTADPDKAIEHDRSGDAALRLPSAGYADYTLHLETALLDCAKVAILHGDGYLCDCIDNTGTRYQSQFLADLLARAQRAADRDA
jgi:Lar family restriction alleviation protein